MPAQKRLVNAVEKSLAKPFDDWHDIQSIPADRNVDVWAYNWLTRKSGRVADINSYQAKMLLLETQIPTHWREIPQGPIVDEYLINTITQQRKQNVSTV